MQWPLHAEQQRLLNRRARFRKRRSRRPSNAAAALRRLGQHMRNGQHAGALTVIWTTLPGASGWARASSKSCPKSASGRASGARRAAQAAAHLEFAAHVLRHRRRALACEQ